MNTARIEVDGRRYDVDPSRNLLETCLGLGIELPFFCWHPAMGSVGACRVCAVKQHHGADDSTGRVVMSCMTSVTDGLRITTDDAELRSARRMILELLMRNHPHDCAVCDEGGECHLQDMTVLVGQVVRRSRAKKRTSLAQHLGPRIAHEPNRCIQCHRCVRFYEAAGGSDLRTFGSNQRLYYGRFEEGALESPFAGNLAEVCPTGVFTDKPFAAHAVRKWDLQSVPSVCGECGLGCNVTPGSRDGRVRRIRARHHAEVNGFFLCDRGRWSAELMGRADRIEQPVTIAPDGARCVLSVDEARARLFERTAGRRVIGIGSPRASLETNFALRRLVGADAFFDGIGPAERDAWGAARRILSGTTARAASLRDVSECDAAIVLGMDVGGLAPMLELALRQLSRVGPATAAAEHGIPGWHADAIQNRVASAQSPLFLVTSAGSALDGVATRSVRLSPAQIPALTGTIATELSRAGGHDLPENHDHQPVAREIAHALRTARRPLVVLPVLPGTASIIASALPLVRALAQSKGRLIDVALVVNERNTTGLMLLEPRPIADALAAAQRGEVDVAIVAENDLHRRLPSESVASLLAAIDEVIVLASAATPTSEVAQLVLPTTTLADGYGTLVNSEGRAQRYFAAVVPGDQVRDGWEWLSRDPVHGPGAVDILRAAMALEFPQLAPLSAGPQVEGTIPRAFPRESGRTALHAHESIREPAPVVARTGPFTYSMEGSALAVPAELVPEFRLPGWNAATSAASLWDGGPPAGGGQRLLDVWPHSSADAVASAEGIEGDGRQRLFVWLPPLPPGELEVPSGLALLNPADLAAASAEASGRVAKIRIVADDQAIRLGCVLDASVVPGCVGLAPDLCERLASVTRLRFEVEGGS